MEGSNTHKLRVDLTPDELQAALHVVGARVSANNEQDTPLERAEREMDLTLLRWEQENN